MGDAAKRPASDDDRHFAHKARGPLREFGSHASSVTTGLDIAARAPGKRPNCGARNKPEGTMVKKASTTETAAPRASGRITKQPMRLRPSTPSEVPTELLELIHSAATGAASKSKLPFESDAVTALEEALEPMLEALCAGALAHAEKAGRTEINEADLKAVAASIFSNKAK